MIFTAKKWFYIKLVPTYIHTWTFVSVSAESARKRASVLRGCFGSKFIHFTSVPLREDNFISLIKLTRKQNYNPHLHKHGRRYPCLRQRRNSTQVKYIKARLSLYSRIVLQTTFLRLGRCRARVVRCKADFSLKL